MPFFNEGDTTNNVTHNDENVGLLLV